MVFKDENVLIDYKIVFGFRSTYEVKNDSLFVDGEARYEITTLSSRALTLKYFDEPKSITYTKTEKDVSDIPILN